MDESQGGGAEPPRFEDTGGFRFVEVEGLILRDYPGASATVSKALQDDPDLCRWQFERSCNHDHPTTDFSRQALRIAREYGDELATALRLAYPDRGFVINYLEEQISFYQCSAGGPEHDVLPTGRLPELAYCEGCGKSQPYRLRGEPDPEFPIADWGDCRICGREVLVVRHTSTESCSVARNRL